MDGGRREVCGSGNVTAYFERYAEACDAFDAEAIAAFYQVPCLMVNDDHVAALPTEDALISNTSALCAYHEREGYGRAHVGDVRVRESSAKVRQVEVDWRIVVSTTHGAV